MTPDQAARVAQILTDNPDVRQLMLDDAVTVVHGKQSGQVWVSGYGPMRTKYANIPAMLQAYQNGDSNAT